MTTSCPCSITMPKRITITEITTSMLVEISINLLNLNMDKLTLDKLVSVDEDKFLIIARTRII